MIENITFYLVLLRELWPLLAIFAVAFALVVVFIISVWRAFNGKDYDHGTCEPSNT